MIIRKFFPLNPASSILFLFVLLFTGNAFAQKNNQAGKGQDVSILSDSATLTKGDYLAHLEKVFETVNKVPVTVASFKKLKPIAAHLTQDEAALALLKSRLTQSDRAMNLQNLQMDQTLLEELRSNNKDCLADLDEYEKELRALKTEILNLRKDTVLIKLFTSPAVRSMFKEQFAELGKKRVVMDSLLKGTTLAINNFQARTSANLINIKELMYLTDNQLDAVSIKAFGKERRYLWESVNKPANKSVGFRRFIKGEQEISGYYFVYTRSSRLLLLFTCAIFFFWVFFNFRSVKQRDRLESLDGFSLINPQPYLITFITLFTLAPIFDLRAPALYIEAVQVILAILLTVFFRKKLGKRLFYYWCVFVVLLLAPVFLRLLGMPPRYQRWLLLFLTVSSVAYGVMVWKMLDEKAKRYKMIVTTGFIYTVFAIIATFCNLFGRFTLTQIFYSTGVSSLLNAISLTILAKVLVEAFLLQMKSSRIRKGFPEYFDWQPVIAGLKRLTGIGTTIIWFVIFTTNLNIFNGLYESVMEILTEKRIIGSFTFTFGGVVLFLGIIWIANFLQKYIAYFFGDTGDDSFDDNKGERSKLLVTRLVLLIGGFLIAVAASGLPIDKITVILGALGVGIGLGLQNIVSNFVSGIILIFDKTIRIGDIVELSDKKGRVKEIGVRASTLLSDEGAEIIIPNGAILSNNIINWTLSNNQMRVNISLSIAKPFNTTEVINLIREVIAENNNVFISKEPVIMISPVSKLSSKINIYFWCKDISKADLTRSMINAQIFEVFEHKGIEIL
ncbi:mechanosensitive ion channel family protein [Pedobacter miscanthi]|uniref:Mechanosensitive ion channel protein n=1 Tax=Pedobacter miscanthi TaxID=2259170 RepID=A0A366L7X4_9SPHI|nr:mechanosensitive ion channel domain-containing protein [Pedobacter miscanthi]RBQ09977.1 mechanosensitive ion channel protein [Pedobacter miscanthi]